MLYSHVHVFFKNLHKYILLYNLHIIVLSLLDMFNEYTSLSGRHEEKRHAMLSDETPLLHMLSYKVNGEQGSDVLCCTIMDIVSLVM